MNTPHSDRSKLNVLVVDDNDINQKLNKSTLVTLGVRNIEVAADGREGLAAVRKNEAANKPFDLIICDWMMPVMDGITFLEKFRETNKRAVFIMVTARTSESDFNEAKDKGADYFFMKPMDLVMLKIRLDGALDASFQRRQKEGLIP